MKSLTKNLFLSGLTAMALVGGVVKGYSQNYINLGVDTNQTWVGYMNVFDLPGSPAYGAVGTYQFGSVWGTADLDAVVSGTNVIIGPNTSICRDSIAQLPPPGPGGMTNTYWWNGQGTGTTNGNKTMDALYYVQNDSLNNANNLLTFSGTCVSNNMIFPYQTIAFIKELASDYSSQVQYSSAPLAAGQPFTVLYNPSGALGAHIQYGFETIGPNANTNSVGGGHPSSYYGYVLVATQAGDPSLKPLASQLATETQQSVTFAVTEIGTTPMTNQWYFISSDGSTTNALSNGSKYSGATSASLTISNIALADAGTYLLNVTNKNGTASVSAGLAVNPITTAQTNYLIDPSFEAENNAWSPTDGWVPFNGASVQNVNDFYYNTSTLISVYEGTNCVQLYPLSQYNGVYQDRPASPGQIFTAYSHVYTSSLDPLSGADAYFMEVIFLDAGGNRLADWQSAFVSTNNPVLDTWLTVTPSTNFTSGGTATYYTAPANTATVRAQGTYYCPNYEAGSVYIDSFVLKLRSTIVTAAVSGSNIQLSFSTIVGPTYNVYYRNSLSSGSWTLLTSTPGDGTVKTVPDALGTTPKFYYVQTTQ
jgi:hypothetical protein